MSAINLICPLILGNKHSESELFGSAVWLWMNSDYHNKIPLFMLLSLLLPAIKKQQFVLGTKNNQPYFFMSWANMNEQSEQKYLNAQNSLSLSDKDWNSGNRIWLIDFIAPFGEVKAIKQLIAKEIFPYSCGRSLYHKGDKVGRKIKFFKGSQVSLVEAKNWQKMHSLILN